MKCFKVSTLSYRHVIGQAVTLVGRAEAIHWATSSRLAARAAGCPRGIVSNGQGAWSNRPAPGALPRGAVSLFSVWRVQRYRRLEPGWGKGPNGSFLEGYAPAS